MWNLFRDEVECITHTPGVVTRDNVLGLDGVKSVQGQQFELVCQETRAPGYGDDTATYAYRIITAPEQSVWSGLVERIAVFAHHVPGMVLNVRDVAVACTVEPLVEPGSDPDSAAKTTASQRYAITEVITQKQVKAAFVL